MENNLETMQHWWDETNFPSKELYSLKENGELVLKPIGNYKERTISTLTPENASATLKALTDKFPEVQAKVSELKKEWDAAEDKMKLVGKVERLKEYLQHTNAVGSFDTLFATVLEMDQQIAKHMDENFAQKQKLVEQAESLAETDNWKEVTQSLRDLTEQWKHIGHSEKHKTDELWNRLEAARTKFFDRKRQNQEETNKEMLQNLDLKMELVEKAEKLAASEDWKEATEAFRTMMEDWKKVGRVMPEKNEELWNRFIMAKNVFYDRKKQHFDTIQHEQEGNYATKLAIVEKAESLKDATQWNETTQAFNELMDQWKKTGRVPHEKADELWNRFSAAREHFFGARKQHFETVRVSLEDNLAQKIALVKRAEALQNSNQWREATDELNELMDEWKKVGPVPREHTKSLWDQFLGARKKFFERKDANREFRKQRAEKQHSVRLNQMHSFVETLEAEIKEEEERLADFKNGIENITPGHKAEELRQHLEKLIVQTEQKIKHKRDKLADNLKQLQKIDQPVVNKEENTTGEDTAE